MWLWISAEEFKVKNYKNFGDELQFSLQSQKDYEFNQEVIHNGIIFHLFLLVSLMLFIIPIYQ